jgi:hypothetical protein
LPDKDDNLEFKYYNHQAKEKFKNRQRTLKKYRFNIEDDKKAKISRVRVPLKEDLSVNIAFSPC